MKKRFIVKFFVFFFIVAMVFASCKGKDQTENAEHSHITVEQYTCPMHPEIIRDKPGKCPICGMDLVPKQSAGQIAGVDTSIAHLLKPVNEQVIARTTIIQPESGTRIFSIDIQGTVTYDTRRQISISSRVSGRIERLYIKYNYQPVKSGQLIMEIYSPDLAAAQRELLYLSRSGGNENQLERARQRLLLLGMQPGQIQQVLKSGKVLYRVPVYSRASGYILEQSLNSNLPQMNSQASVQTQSTSGGDMGGMNGGGSSVETSSSSALQNSQLPTENTPVLVREGQYVAAGQTLFTVYNNQSLVAEFALTPELASQVKRGQRLVFRKTAELETFFSGSIGLIQPTFRAGTNFTIARVYIQDSRLKAGQLLSANIPVVNRGWWVPASAVLQLGNQSIVFKKEGSVFVPKAIQRGIIAEGMIQITEGVSGWEIAKNAAFLVDSESFIKIGSNTQTQQP